MNYLKKILSLFSFSKIKKNKLPNTVLEVWRTELIVVIILFLLICVADFWIYISMVSRGIEASSDRVRAVEALNKRAIVSAVASIGASENALNSSSFPLIRNPF